MTPRLPALALALGALAAAGCGRGATVATATRADQSYSGDRADRVLDWGDIERYRGTVVSVEGEFDHIGGEHGRVRLDSGLVVYVPNVMLFLRGEPWYDYRHKRVLVSGVLRTEGCDIPGYSGPSIQSVSFFRVVAQ